MSEHVVSKESIEERLSPVRRPRISILEMMLLVAALAVSFRLPGVSVSVGLLFLYALAQRRNILRRQTRVALGQIALALYLPPTVLGLLLVPCLAGGNLAIIVEGWDRYLEIFPFMPTFIPWALILGLSTARDALGGETLFGSPQQTVATVVLSMISPLAVIGGLGVVARRGRTWRMACLIVAAAMSAASTFLTLAVLLAGA
jgi:hypothetical protein